MEVFCVRQFQLVDRIILGILTPREEGMHMTGTVTGILPLSRTHPICAEYRWVRVRVGQETVSAVDPVGCEAGERVLLVSGDAAQRFCMGCPGDLCVAGVLEESGNNG